MSSAYRLLQLAALLGDEALIQIDELFSPGETRVAVGKLGGLEVFRYPSSTTEDEVNDTSWDPFDDET